jgi:hypothetical protein
LPAPLLSVLSLISPIEPKSPLRRSDINFIDVGAGKGYFSVFMATELRVRALTIEASLSNASHLKSRIGCLVSQKKVAADAFDLMTLCIGYMTTQTNIDAIHVNSMSSADWLSVVARMEAKPPKRKRSGGTHSR